MTMFYFIGDSITHGDDLTVEERKTKSWPALISQHHNVEFVNDGAPGGTNDRNISKILQNISKYDRMYIQWSYINRFTLHDPKNWFEVNFNQLLTHDLYGKVDYYEKFGKYYYGFWSSPLFEFKKFLEQIILIQSLLEKNNQSYLMLNSKPGPWSDLICDQDKFIANLKSLIPIDNFDDKMIMQQYFEIQQLYKQIDLSHYMYPERTIVDDIMQQFPRGSTGHFLPAGEKCYADTILNFEKGIY